MFVLFPIGEQQTIPSVGNSHHAARKTILAEAALGKSN
jgi:hypothetical protein